MKAARYYGQGDIRIDDIPEPTPGPGQVQVAVDWCGICGTDLHEYLEGPIFIPPKGSPHPITGAELPAVVMGHEFAGVVSGVGAGVTGVSEGDRVASSPTTCAGSARLHGRALQHLPQARLHRAGRQRGRLRREDASSTRSWIAPARRPPDRRRRARRAARRRLPRGAAVRAEAGRHGGGVRLRADRAGHRGRAEGHRRREVIVVEPAAARKAKAPGAGADACSTRPRPTSPTRSRDLTGGAGADVAFECAGIDAVLGVGDRRGPAGRHGRQRRDLGPPGHGRDERLVFSEIDVIGSLAYCGDHPDTIELLQDGKVDADAVHHRPHRPRRHRRGRVPPADRQQGGEREDPGVRRTPMSTRSSPAPAGGSAAGSRCGWPATGTPSPSTTSTRRPPRPSPPRSPTAGGRALAVPADVADRDAVFAMVERAADRAGQRRRDGRQRGHRPGQDAARADARGPAEDVRGQPVRRRLQHAGRRRADESRRAPAARSSMPRRSPRTRASTCSATTSATKFGVRALTQAAAKELAKRQDHGQRLLPGHRRHRHVGPDRRADGRPPRHRQGRGAGPVLASSSRWAACRHPTTSPGSSPTSPDPIRTT